MENARYEGNGTEKGQESKPYLARMLSIDKSEHRNDVAQVLRDGGISVIAFNGPYGIFGDAYNLPAVKRILQAKNRPEEKSPPLVVPPEYLDEHVDFSSSKFTKEQISGLMRGVHALGLILPASKDAPSHLVKHVDSKDTILTIWTEYSHMREIFETFRGIGGKALVGTSANKSGDPTHNKFEEVYAEFKQDVDTVLVDETNFSHLDEIRKRSTTILDLMGETPRLHRSGNVQGSELQNALAQNGFPKLRIDEQVIFVNPRS